MKPKAAMYTDEDFIIIRQSKTTNNIDSNTLYYLKLVSAGVRNKRRYAYS